MFVWRRRFQATCAIALAAFALSCSSSSTLSSETSQTLITVDPSTFSQGVVCDDLQGAWKSYVATLIDVTDPQAPKPLSISSPPVPCAMPVSFTAVTDGHRYTARIEGYDRDDLRPSEQGSSDLIDPATNEKAPPRWTASCGIPAELQDAEPTTAVLRYDVTVGDCTTLKDSKSEGETGIALDLSSVRGSLECGKEPGQVDHLRVIPDAPSLKEIEAKCDKMLSFLSLTPGTDYSFRVEAFEPDSEQPRWATTCERRAQKFTTLPATCNTLSEHGALRVDISELLEAVGHSCSQEDIVSYRSILVGGGVANNRACSVDTVFNGLFAPLDPAEQEFVVDGFDADSKQRFTASCRGVVIPATTTSVSCIIQ